MKKRFCALVLSLLFFCACISPLPTRAAPSVIFTAINDTFLRNLTPSTMPTIIGGLPYVPYTTFTAAPNPGLMGKYDSVNNQLVLYNINHILTFDMANAITRDEQGNVYPANAVRHNGTYYVPARVVCDAFGFRYSYLSSTLLGPVIRINTDDSGISDEDLVSKGFSVMRSIYDQYQATYNQGTDPDPDTPTPPTPVDPDTPTDPGEPEIPSTSGEPDTPETPNAKVVYLAIQGDMNEYTAEILDILDSNNYTAAFFVTPRSQGQNSDYLLRAAASGHVIGNNLYGDGSTFQSTEELLRQAQDTQDVIQAVTKTHSRALMVPGGSQNLSQEERDALIQAGYRLWDPSGDTRLWGSASAIYSSCVSLLENTSGNVVLSLMSNPSSVQALSSLVSYFRQNNCEIRPISETITPINQIREMR